MDLSDTGFGELSKYMNEDRVDSPELESDAIESDEFEIALDVSSFPIVEVTFPKRTTIASLNRHFASLVELAEQNENFALLIHIDHLISASKPIRTHAAAKLTETNRMIGGSVVCVAHIADNWLGRAVLTVVLSASKKSSYPERTFRRRSAAVAWARSKLAAS